MSGDPFQAHFTSCPGVAHEDKFRNVTNFKTLNPEDNPLPLLDETEYGTLQAILNELREIKQLLAQREDKS